ILEIEIDKDHIHLLVKSEPKVSILAIVRKLKQETTNRLWKSQGNYLKRFYWGEKTLWSYRYFASTIGNVSKETATAYIRNQG
ncbi:MAG TPA: IS200/IS605 family transposase, partial [Methanosarcina sp.]|nr:IS200/IS605 family transposase [Methanosarcina sp.]